MTNFDSLFKPTPMYKELRMLNLLTNNPQITQRAIAKEVGISLAMVNSYLEEYENRGLVNIVHDSTRLGQYSLTKKGHERRKLLNMEFLEASLDVYNQAKYECINFINKIKDNGYNNVLFYGAGEVCELLLYVINNVPEMELNVLGIVDDDVNKIGKTITNIDIISKDDINKYNYDGILVSSYTNNDIIKQKLIELNIEDNKIIEFFNGSEESL